MKLAHAVLALSLAALSGTATALTQSAITDADKTFHPAGCAISSADNVHTFYLKYVTQPSDANEIYTAIRNMLPQDTKSFLISSQNAIMICPGVGPDILAVAQKMIADLDRPHKNYRLTYTVTEVDGTKAVGTQHFVLIAEAGQHVVLKQGSKIPVATGSFGPTGSSGTTSAGVQTQFTYLDIGMNFDATLYDSGSGVNLNTSVEQSSAADQVTIAGVQEPLIRQTSVKGVLFMIPGKPMMLGSVDIPGSTRRLDIEVTMEELH